MHTPCPALSCRVRSAKGHSPQADPVPAAGRAIDTARTNHRADWIRGLIDPLTDQSRGRYSDD